MRRTLVLLFLMSLFVAACAAIIGFPDVPSVGDGGYLDSGPMIDGTAPDAGKKHVDASHPKKGEDAHADVKREASHRDVAVDSKPDVPLPPPPSCAPGGPGMTNCGPDASPESCCTTLEVPGGDFFRAYDPIGADGGPHTAPDGGPFEAGAPAELNAVRVDKYLVTVGRFRQFFNAWTAVADASTDGSVGVADARDDGHKKDAKAEDAKVEDAKKADAKVEDAKVEKDAAKDAGSPVKAYRPPVGSGKHTELNGGLGLAGGGDAGTKPKDGGPPAFEPGWTAADDALVDLPALAQCSNTSWTVFAGTQENLPVNCVNWYEAYAFCIWDGGFLPSEGEWEFTAAGGSEQRLFPWGSTLPGTDLDYAIYDCNYPIPSVCADSSIFRLAPVGTPTRGAGRWLQLDLGGELREWAYDYYAAIYEVPCVNCADLTPAVDRVVRGASYVDTGSRLVPSNRAFAAATTRDSEIGVRCARAP